jgi:hypothetical protein
MYVDLDELDELFEKRWFWSAKRFNLAWFRRDDHLGNAESTLKQSVMDRVESETGYRPGGPIRLLTHFRYLGFGFNPVSFYFCFDAEGESLETIVCEVNNTPWGEQHVYVLPVRKAQRRGHTFQFEQKKDFHVSPFMPMEMDYDWRFSEPGERLNVHMRNLKADAKVFDATLMLSRVPLNARSLNAILLKHPLMTLKVVAAIYFEALRLLLKKTPFYPHPDKVQTSPEVKRS